MIMLLPSQMCLWPIPKGWPETLRPPLPTTSEKEETWWPTHIITTVCSMGWLVWEHWRGKWWCKQVLVSFSTTGQRVAGWRWLRPQKMRWRGWMGSWKWAWRNCVIIRHPDWRGFVVLLWKDGKIVPTPRSRKMIEYDCDEAPVSIVDEFIDLRQEDEWELI